jgi:hypothetical protein
MTSLTQVIEYLRPGINLGPGGTAAVIDKGDGQGQQILFWRDVSAQPTPAEIAAAMPAAQAAYDAAEAQRLADKADRQELRDSFAQWRDTLQGVRDEAAWTNAKRDAALKDMARIQVKMLKILRDIALP